MTEDAELLRQYAEGHSEPAFEEVVRRHLDLVYFTALRKLNGDAHRAKDISQVVFIKLARHAASLSRHPVLAGWLYTTSRNEAAQAVRTDIRRQKRERETQATHEITQDSPPVLERARMAPIIDDVLHQLNRRDREAIVLRFFQNRPFAEIGEKQGLGENAARMRVNRALDRLRAKLEKRGIPSTAAAVGLLLAEEGGVAAPIGLAESISSAALASAVGGAATGMGVLSFFSGDATLGILGGASLIAILGFGIAAYEFRAARQAQATLAIAREESQARETLRRDLEQRVGAADGREAELRESLDQANTRASGRDPKADGANFMATFGQARAMLQEGTRLQIFMEYAPFFKSAGFTPAQIEQFLNQTLALLLDHEAVTPPTAIHSIMGQLPDDQLIQFLGNRGFEQYQDYSRLMGGQMKLLMTVGGVAASNADPLSSDQIVQLARIVANNNSTYQGGDNTDLSAEDWDAADAQAKSVLSPLQWQMMRGLFAQAQFGQALAKAQREAVAAAQSAAK